MAKTQLIRKSFNAGELSPELHYRDDLAAYVKGCKHLTNMVPTPYGAVTRRPPFEVLSKIDTALYGVPVRYIPFKFSLTEVFHIVFTDGSGSESEDPTTADLIIFDGFGAQVIFEGVAGAVELSALPLALDGTTIGGTGSLNTGFVAMANTIYDPAFLNEIHYINVNDFVYLTCGGKYPVQAINRFFDNVEGANRWKIEEWVSNTGPFADTNTEADTSITIVGEPWDPLRIYGNGQSVFPEGAGTTNDITSVQWELKYGDRCRPASFGNFFTTDFFIGITTENAHGFEVGDLAPIFGVNVGDEPIDGTYPVLEVLGTNSFSIASSQASLCVPVGYGPPDPVNVGEVAFVGDIGSTIYEAIQDVPAGTLVTDTAYWKVASEFFGEGRVSCTKKIFSPEDVGRLIKVENNTDTWVLALTRQVPLGSGESVSFPITGDIEMKTEGGAWSGRLYLEQSIDRGLTWNPIGELVSIELNFNGSIERFVNSISSIVRVRHEGIAGKCFLKVRAIDTTYTYSRIINYISEQSVTVQLLSPITYPLTDSNWALGAFGGKSGYPYSLTIHDERLCLGGSQEKPNTVFASSVNRWDDFRTGSSDTSPYTFTIASDSFDTIRSLKSSRQLNVLTDNAENTMGSRDDNAITSVTNISVSSHTNYGSNGTQAIQLADMIWFVMGQGERVRASKYDFASDGQQSIEMSLFASHITESGIKEMSFRRHPFNSLFCLLNNGTGAVLTYEGTQEVKAWATVKTEGKIISAASNYSDTGDIIAGVVERGGSYFLEQFGSVDAGTVFLDNQTTWTDANFDLGQTIEQDDDGNLVVILDDTELVRDVDYTIAGGVLTIPSQLTGDVCIGRRIECRVNPTDISEVAPSGIVKRLTELGMYLLDSGTCNVEINGKPSPFTDGVRWVAGQRESGLFELTTGGDYEQGLDVNITIDGHRHFTLTGLGYRLGISQG